MLDEEWWPPRETIPQSTDKGDFYNFYVTRGGEGFDVLVHQHQDGSYHVICDAKRKEYYAYNLLDLRAVLLHLAYAERTILPNTLGPPN